MLLLVLVTAFTLGKLRNDQPSPEVRRLLPQVVLFLEHKDPISLASPHPRSKWTLFCGVRYLGNSPPGEQFNLYVWEVCQEYRADGARLAGRSGWSAPAAIWIVKRADGYSPEAEFQSYTNEDVPRIFPKSLRKKIYAMEGSDAVGRMEADTKRRACLDLLQKRTCKLRF
jgi:hypothetical protein